MKKLSEYIFEALTANSDDEVKELSADDVESHKNHDDPEDDRGDACQKQ